MGTGTGNSSFNMKSILLNIYFTWSLMESITAIFTVYKWYIHSQCTLLGIPADLAICASQFTGNCLEITRKEEPDLSQSTVSVTWIFHGINSKKMHAASQCVSLILYTKSFWVEKVHTF